MADLASGAVIWRSLPNTFDLRPTGAVICRTVRNRRIVFNSSRFPSILLKHDIIDKTGSTLIALPPVEDRATTTGNLYRKLGKVMKMSLYFALDMINLYYY